MRSIDELVRVDNPAWPRLRDELAKAPVPITVLPADAGRGRACLHALQVTARSRLGALALNTGGLMVENGWLRVLGGGSPDLALPDLVEANPSDGGAPPTMLVGYDVLGGRFEINGDPAAAGRPGNPGEICYFAPESLAWKPLGMGHAAWLSYLARGGTSEFYADVRWPGWQDEVRRLRGDQGMSIVPPLWSREAAADLAATSRRPVPVHELFGMQRELAGDGPS